MEGLAISILVLFWVGCSILNFGAIRADDGFLKYEWGIAMVLSLAGPPMLFINMFLTKFFKKGFYFKIDE